MRRSLQPLMHLQRPALRRTNSLREEESPTARSGKTYYFTARPSGSATMAPAVCWAKFFLVRHCDADTFAARLSEAESSPARSCRTFSFAARRRGAAILTPSVCGVKTSLVRLHSAGTFVARSLKAGFFSIQPSVA